MSQSTLSDNKKKMGRPSTGVGTMIGVRLHPADLTALDAWIAGQGDQPSRPEAVRKLIRLALAAKAI
tara:strand:- start:428 stop:628 length:201 start_codon:yes stop_codon:yes gene_type:complete